MTAMPSLFDSQPRKRVRRTDPDTSKAAAGSLDPLQLSEQRRKVLWAIAVMEHYGHSGKPGATTAEIVMRLSYTGHAPQQSVVARRCTDLRDAGYIVDSGERRPGTSNTPLIVWVLTEAGRAATA